MTDNVNQDWPHPGSRWRKFYFHALLDIIDEAAEVGDLHRGFKAGKRTCFSQRACFENHILRFDGGEPSGGLALNLAVADDGDAEIMHAFDFGGGQCKVVERGALQEKAVREEVCRVMEGGREAFSRRWARLGREV